MSLPKKVLSVVNDRAYTTVTEVSTLTAILGTTAGVVFQTTGETAPGVTREVAAGAAGRVNQYVTRSAIGQVVRGIAAGTIRDTSPVIVRRITSWMIQVAMLGMRSPVPWVAIPRAGGPDLAPASNSHGRKQIGRRGGPEE